MDTQMEKLLAVQERALQQKNEAERKAKQAKKKIEDLKRKLRTQRLIIRGAFLEKFIPDAENLSDGEIQALLTDIFNAPDNQRRLRTWLEAHHERESTETVVVDGAFNEGEESDWFERSSDGAT